MVEQRFLSRLSRWVSLNLAALAEMREQKQWIRQIRLARGLKGRELAERMGVSPARISVLEQDEREGRVTLRMMQKAASALDCELVYMLVPKESLRPVSKAQSVLSQKPRLRVSE